MATCDATTCVDTVNSGKTVSFEANGVSVELSKEDILILPISKEGFTSEGDGKITVVLNTELTEELKELGLVRELISKIQATRKDSGFEVTDHISIVANASTETNLVLEKYKNMIMSSTLADSFEVGNASNGTKLDLNGEEVEIVLKKS